jgi:hypothetical protein
MHLKVARTKRKVYGKVRVFREYNSPMALVTYRYYSGGSLLEKYPDSVRDAIDLAFVDFRAGDNEPEEIVEEGGVVILASELRDLYDGPSTP